MPIAEGFKSTNAPNVETIACQGGRCSYEVKEKNSGGSNEVCLQAKAWTESKACGGPANAQFRFCIGTERNEVDDFVEGLLRACLKKARLK